MRTWLGVAAALVLLACSPAQTSSSAPCFAVQKDEALRPQDADKTLDDLSKRIRLPPEDEALRSPKSLDDIRTILRRDVVYLFPNAAAYARSMDTVEGRFGEASLELLLGESMLVASQVLSMQAAWVSGDLRVARASLAIEQGEPTTDRGRLLAQLIRVVEEGNKIADALGVVAPRHLTRGAEVVRRLRTEAPTELRTYALVAEYHRLRGEWQEFDAAMASAESADRASPALPYLRAMEQLERFRKPKAAAQILRDCLEKYPRFVRAQAALILTTNNPRGALRELAKLKQMNQDHYIVMLLEPTLAADQELAKMQNHGDEVEK